MGSKAQIRVQTTTKWSRPNTYVSETLSSQRTGTIVSSRTLLSFMDENIIASGIYILCLLSNTKEPIDFCCNRFLLQSIFVVVFFLDYICRSFAVLLLSIARIKID